MPLAGGRCAGWGGVAEAAATVGTVGTGQGQEALGVTPLDRRAGRPRRVSRTPCTRTTLTFGRHRTGPRRGHSDEGGGGLRGRGLHGAWCPAPSVVILLVSLHWRWQEILVFFCLYRSCCCCASDGGDNWRPLSRRQQESAQNGTTERGENNKVAGGESAVT